MTTTPPPGRPRWFEREQPADVIRRIKRTAWLATAVFAIFSAISGGFRGFIGLTCSAAVTMISFLWLEEIVDVLLQPAAHLHARRLTVRTLARFALLGVALTVTIIVARFNALSVLLGFSIIVVGICGEALYSLYREVAQK
ncbi:MAG TPA: ATP synthase subunit I [Thermoanaerobaculia bacterium]